jgi:hypothetical protein
LGEEQPGKFFVLTDELELTAVFKGNTYLAGYGKCFRFLCPPSVADKFGDGSFYYFNTDGSVYGQNAPPDPSTPQNIGSSLYISPVTSRHYTPSSQEKDQPGGRYFVGFDWRTDERKYYWDDGEGIIVRTLKKNLDFSLELEQHDVRTYANKDGVERVVIVDGDCNYLGENKIILEELRDLPDEDSALMLTDEILHPPPTVSIEETVPDEVEIKAEIIIKTEEDMLQEIDTPSFSETEENKHEECGESVLDHGPSNVDDRRRIDHPSIMLALEILVSKSDSQPRSSRIVHQAAASSVSFRVTKAGLQRQVSRK